MKLLPCLLSAAAMLALPAPAPAITIEIRYNYDTNGFFNRPGAREALEAVASFYEGILHDNLRRIAPGEWPTGNVWTPSFQHPGTGADQSESNLVVPEDTLIVYAGGRSLGGAAGRGGPGGYSASGNQTAWFDLLKSRGQAGALATPATDFGPWGGSISFEQSLDWSFSTTGPEGGKVPFVTIALHEMGHLLGIGTAPSWTARISGNVFNGPLATQVFGGPVPVTSGHWRDDGACQGPDGYDPANNRNVLSKAYGIFGVPHGYSQIVLMDPSTCSAGPFLKVMTDLDLAGLRDTGWELEPPPRFQNATTRPGSPFSFSWPSTSGVSYRLQTSTTLAANSWNTLVTRSGNGEIQQYTTPAPAGARAFYRLETFTVPAAMIATPSESLAPVTVPHVHVEGCRCGAAWAVE